MSTHLPEVWPTPSSGRRRTSRRHPARRPIPRFDSWQGVVWTIVIALDFFWFANPRVLVSSFDRSLLIAGIVTTVGTAITFSSLRVPRPAESVLAVLALALASVLWSINPDQTFAFTMRYVLIAAVATVIARNADVRAVVHGIVLGGLTVLGVSVYAIARSLPGAEGPSSTVYTFAGVGGNRNILSFTLILALAFGVSLVPRSWWARLLWAPAIVALFVGIVLAKSTTSLAVAPLLVVVAVALLVSDRRRLSGRTVSRRRRRLIWVTGVAGAVATVVGALLIGRFLGDDVRTLSGRTPIWEAVWHTTTGVNRWFGSGWGAVWPHQWAPAPNNPEFRAIIKDTGYIQWHGHNSVFDLIPELGLVGVAVYACTYVQAIGHAHRLRPSVGPVSSAALQASRAAILPVVALLVVGLTEPMSTIPLGWFTTVLLATGLAVPVRRRSAELRVRGADGGPGSQLVPPATGEATTAEPGERQV